MSAVDMHRVHTWCEQIDGLDTDRCSVSPTKALQEQLGALAKTRINAAWQRQDFVNNRDDSGSAPAKRSKC